MFSRCRSFKIDFRSFKQKISLLFKVENLIVFPLIHCLLFIAFYNVLVLLSFAERGFSFGDVGGGLFCFRRFTISLNVFFKYRNFY